MGQKKRRIASAQRWPNNIEALSIERGWSQADLARVTGFTPQEITRWWNGSRELHQSHIRRFAEAFQCPDGDILNALAEAREEREFLQMLRRFDENTKARYKGMGEGLEAQTAKPKKTETAISASSAENQPK